MSIQDTESGLPHQKKAWSQHDLLASVLSSYVDIVHEKGGRWPSWGVSSRTENIHADLKQVNAHLDRLGWMAKLTKDEAWVMTVFPIPERQFPRVNSLVAFWILSFFTLTLAGNVWMSSVRPDGGWFHSSTFLDAVLGYALPVMVLLFCASFVQRKVAQRYGVRAGHLIPVPDLTIALYAMGLFLRAGFSGRLGFYSFQQCHEWMRGPGLIGRRWGTQPSAFRWCWGSPEWPCF